MGIERVGGRSRIPAAMAVLVAAIAAAPTARAGGSFVDCGAALRETIASGRPTVVVVTSRAVPASTALRDAIARELLGSAIGESVRFAELPVELYPDRVGQLGIERFPTLLAYGRQGGALARLGRLDGPADVLSVAAWLGSLGLSGGGAAGASADPAVARTAMVGGDRGRFIAVPAPAAPMPTPQGPPPSPPTPTPGMAVVPVAPPPSMSTVVTQPGPPPIVVQPQSPQIYVQPMAPRIILGQMPAPEITVLQQPQAPPTVNFGVVNAPQAGYVPYQSAPMPMPSPQSPASAFPTATTLQAPAYAPAPPAAPGLDRRRHGDRALAGEPGPDQYPDRLHRPRLLPDRRGAWRSAGILTSGSTSRRPRRPFRRSRCRRRRPCRPTPSCRSSSPASRRWRSSPIRRPPPLPGPPARGVTPSPQGPPPTPTKHGLIGHLFGHR